jgi:import inner membrane translocase subunit TIM8
MDPSANPSPELQQFLARESQIAQVQQMISTLSDVCWCGLSEIVMHAW